MKLFCQKVVTSISAVICFGFLNIAKTNARTDQLPNWLQRENQDRENPIQQIVGGVPVDPKDRYPYQVALTLSSGSQYCGGFLIAPDWVLSAAHCAGAGSRVQIGRWNLIDSTEDYEDIEVDYEVTHPDYIDNLAGSFENDFMLLKLKNSSQYHPVSIDQGNQNIDSGKNVTTMGWGATSFQGSSSDILLEVEIDIVGNNECNFSYYSFLGLNVTEKMLCAARPGKDSCQGDSGGPLIIKGADHTEDVAIGIVSWGYECASPDFPGVYARISKGFDWISEYVSFPTASPTTSAPTGTPCPDSKKPFQVEVQTDRYGNDITFYLQRKRNGNNKGFRKKKFFYRTKLKSWNNKIFKTCLQKKKCYRFTILDKFGDGLCCTWGEGFYRLNFNGREIKSSSFENKPQEQRKFGFGCKK